jgi:cytochrome d ubiquinol oxidase subunit I
MKVDATTLSRLQFAWVIGWHILLPAFTIGLHRMSPYLKTCP